MLKKTVFAILFSIFLFGCDSSSNTTDKTCSPECSEWEICSDGGCQTADGRCVQNSDCSEDKPVCNLETHICESEIVQNCDENSTKCENSNLFTCTNNQWVETDCVGSGKICQTENSVSSCVEEQSGELTIPQVKALTESKTVTTSGVVTHVIYYESKVVGLYIQSTQDSNGAIFVMIQNGVNLNVANGNEVKVTGLAWSRFGVIRIGDQTNIPTVQVTSTTTTTPEAKDITSETFTVGEVDMLLNATDAPFTVTELGESSPYFTKLQGASGAEFIISSKLYRFNENGLTVGSVISELKGVGASYQDETDLSFTFMIQPRDANDIIFSNSGTEGKICRDAQPYCNSGLVCLEGVCVVKTPCNSSCTTDQYCDVQSDTCIDLEKSTVAEVRAVTEPTYVWTEGVISKIDRKNQTTANIYFQDGTEANSGLQIYFKNAPVPALSIGQRIKVTGLAHDYQGIIEIGSADEQPTITVLESDIELAYKQIAATELNSDNIYILSELQNGPFTVTRIDGYYSTLKDSLNNSFLVNTDWIGYYLTVGDVFSEIKGVISYRYSGGVIFTINPRNLDEIIFAE
ncbi:hypothetical protein JXR93_01280 [bacterium]|nr:hypothetical protein [bacterium]